MVVDVSLAKASLLNCVREFNRLDLLHNMSSEEIINWAYAQILARPQTFKGTKEEARHMSLELVKFILGKESKLDSIF